MTTQVIDVIDTCNLACPYCFWPINSLKKLSLEQFKKKILDDATKIIGL